MSEAIRSSIDAGHLDDSWDNWTREAWVSVATRTDGHPVEARLYTYLPMEGEAQAPLHGHLHAPFSTKLARTAVSETVPLNAFLLDHAARAATAAVVTFATAEDVLPPAALVDLLAWDDAHHDRVTASFTDANVDMPSACLIPIHPLPDDRGRGAFESTYSWDFDVSLLEATRLARDAGAELVAGSISGERLDRLERYCEAFIGGGFQASADVRAGWIEAAAGALHGRTAKPGTWDRFYGDLAVIFAEDAVALRGRALLPGDDGKLHASPSDADDVDQPLVFFPPARERTDEDDEVEGDFDLKPPASLRSTLILMSEELSWNRQDGRRRRATPARRFLEDSKLVRRFKTLDLLEHVGRALTVSKSVKLSSDALRFAFNLYASTRNVRREDLRELGLRVPCESGWRQASEALFSSGWKTPRSEELNEFLERGAGASRELQSLGERFLVSPGDWPSSVGDQSRWQYFLHEIGVRDGLWPVAVPHGSDGFEGQQLVPASLARRFRLTDRDAQRWVDAVKATPNHRPAHPYTAYRSREPIAVLPGQGDYDRFDQRTRSVFAALVLSGLNDWGDGALSIVWARSHPRHRSSPDERVWPSPLAAFLADAAWMPTSEPGERQDDVFVRPRDAWFFSDAKGDGLPHFSPLVTPNARRLLSASAGVLAKAKSLGLGDWRDPDHAPRLLRHLATLVAAGELSEAGYLAFRRAHEDAWARAARWTPSLFAEAMQDSPLVLSRSGAFSAEHPSQISDPQIYVLDERRSLAARVLDASGLPILAIGGAEIALVAQLLAALVGDRVTTLNALDIEVVTDAGPFVPTAEHPRLVNGQLAWMSSLVQLILEAKRVRFDASTARRRSEIGEKLNRVRACHSPNALIRVGGVTVDVRGEQRRAVPIDDADYPTLISTVVEPLKLNLDSMIGLAPALCELLGIADYQATLALALERLRATERSEPTDADFARMLDLDPAQVSEVFSHLGAPVDALIRLLAPVLVYFAGVESGKALLGRAGKLESERDLAAVIELLAPATPSPAVVVTAARDAGSLPELRRLLELDYGRFNAALRELGDDYEPIHNTAAHAQALAHHLELNREDVLLGLRLRFVAAFRERRPLGAYVRLRDLRSIMPDPGWLDAYDVPPDQLLKERIDAWTAGLGEDPPTGVSLVHLAEARKANHKTFSTLVETARPLVQAWARKRDAAISDVWTHETTVSDITELANASGTLDFELLDQGEIITWLGSEGHWPDDMPRSLDREVLELSESDLAAAGNAHADKRRALLLQRRLLTLDGQEFAAGRDGYGAIVSHVNATLREDLLRVGMSAARLGEMPTAATQDGKDRERGPGHVIRRKRLSDEQTAAIGLVGETIAFAWLSRRYPEVCSPSAWRSSYCETVGEPPGDDTLGYDFAIVLKTRTVYFEVKATSGTETAFELGESEVGRARDCARSSRYQYRVLFITDALDAGRRTLFVLPNPMDPANQALFRYPGSGLTCTFRLEQ